MGHRDKQLSQPTSMYEQNIQPDWQPQQASLQVGSRGHGSHNEDESQSLAKEPAGRCNNNKPINRHSNLSGWSSLGINRVCGRWRGSAILRASLQVGSCRHGSNNEDKSQSLAKEPACRCNNNKPTNRHINLSGQSSLGINGVCGRWRGSVILRG